MKKHIENCIFNDQSGNVLDWLEEFTGSEIAAMSGFISLLKEGWAPKGLKRNNKLTTQDLTGDIYLNPEPKPKRVKVTDDKLEALKGCVLQGHKDDVREALRGVYYDVEEQMMIATDAHVLAGLGAQLEGESRIVSPMDNKIIHRYKGETLVGRFPNWKAAIPEAPLLIDNIKVSDIIAICNAAIMRLKWFDLSGEGYPVTLQVFNEKGEDVYFDPENIMRGATALAANGVEKVHLYWNGSPTKALMMRSSTTANRDICLCMPAVLKTEDLHNVIIPLIDLRDEADKPITQERAMLMIKEGEDLTGRDLSGMNFRFLVTEDQDFSGCNLQGCDFEGSSLRYANFEGANLQDCNFRNCNLMEANLQKVDARRADFSDAIMDKVDLTNADMQKTDLQIRSMCEAQVAYCNFTGATLRGDFGLTDFELSIGYVDDLI